MEITAQAYVVRGGDESIPEIVALLKKEGSSGNPDLLIRTYSSFTIDDARTLRDRAALRGVGGAGRIFILVAPTIPADAQNALLKTFEEPPAGARFVLVVPAPETLLPTLRSRMQVLELQGEDSRSLVDAKQFLKTTPEKRLEMLKPYLEKGDDDKRDLAGTLSFLADLERALSTKPRENAEGLRALYRTRKYITDRGALAKALLEQAALIMPKVL